jgi:hypothetical protein
MLKLLMRSISLPVLIATIAMLVAAAPSDTSGPDFPRLAIWYPTYKNASMAERARFDLIVGDFVQGVPGVSSKQALSAELRKANSQAKLLTYYRPLVIRPSSLYEGTRKHNPALRDWPASWFMTEAGSTLSNNISANSTVLNVTDWQRSGEAQGGKPKTWDIWTASQDVQLGTEIMTIVSVDKAKLALTVKRGMNGTSAVAHARDTRIAPLARFWRGSYVMNMTDSSGTGSVNAAAGAETYAQYAFRMSREGANEWFSYTGGDQDGFLWDMLPDNLSWLMWTQTNSLDLNRDNQPDSFSELDSQWTKALNDHKDLFLQNFPGKAIVRNQSRSRDYSSYNGESFVSFPHDQWNAQQAVNKDGWTRFWHNVFFGDKEEVRGGITEFQNGTALPNYTQVITDDLEMDLDEAGFPELRNPDTATIWQPNYRKMRWGLCSALLSGSYYGYVITTDGFGLRGIEWFDEYDDAGAGRGYLGKPAGEIEMIGKSGKDSNWGVWGREYTGGYVIVNPLDKDMAVSLPPGKWQRIRGEQVPSVNSGAIEEGTVTVPAFDGLILKRV